MGVESEDDDVPKEGTSASVKDNSQLSTQSPSPTGDVQMKETSPVSNEDGCTEDSTVPGKRRRMDCTDANYTDDAPASNAEDPEAANSYASRAKSTELTYSTSETWRAAWYSAVRTTTSSPLDEDAIFELILSTPAVRAQNFNLACPEPLSDVPCVEFRIEGALLSSTFPLGVILDSLSCFPQPPAWSSNLAHFRGFSLVKGKGVRFLCTDANAAKSIRYCTVTICGVEHKVSLAHKISSYYTVQLHRVPGTASAAVFYQYFKSLGCDPLVIYPTHDCGGLVSDSLTIMFNGPNIPKPLWSGKPTDAPLREIQLIPDGEYAYIEDTTKNVHSLYKDLISSDHTISNWVLLQSNPTGLY
ncbi:unnamed protein product [Aphanomyces euteiches]